MSAGLLVVVSGLPASGKTTVGRALSRGLGLPLVDKDDILEALFDSLGCDDRGQRERLSRASDTVLFTMAAASRAAVVVNWWNHDTSPRHLRDAADAVVEVFCECPLDVAAARFRARERHLGHLDRLRSTREHAQGMRALRDSYRGPLALGGPLVTVDTSREIDAYALVGEVRSAITGQDEAQVVAAAEERTAALAAADADRLTRLLHPDFVWTTHTGATYDRDAYVDRNTGGRTVWRSQALTAPEVDVVGDTAVLRATVVDEVLADDGEPQTFRMPMTQVWVRTDTGWACLAGHAGPRAT